MAIINDPNKLTEQGFTPLGEGEWESLLTGEKTNETLLNLMLAGVPAAGKALQGAKSLKHLRHPGGSFLDKGEAGTLLLSLMPLFGNTLLAEQLSNLTHGKVDMPTKKELSNWIREKKGQSPKESFEGKGHEYKSRFRYGSKFFSNLADLMTGEE